MRTLVLKEYLPSKPTHLTRPELLALQATGVVGTTPAQEEDEYILRAGSVVGTIVLPTLRLLIKPKIDIENLLFLLGFRPTLVRWADRLFPYEREPDLLKMIAWLFNREVERAMAYGLVRGYQAREEDLLTLRGRIDISQQIRKRQSRVIPLACRFDEFTEDVPLNRVLKGAHARLLQMPILERHLIRSLRFRARFFADVEHIEYRPGDVPRLSFNRLNEHWEPAGRLAVLILENRVVRDEEGAVLAGAFTVDMNRVFEKFLEEVVGEAARRAGLALSPQAARYLTSDIPMQPDLVITWGGTDVAVGDAKYKELEIKEWPHADLYQLLAYCISLDLRRGLLIYGGPRKLERHLVQNSNIELEVMGLDLTGSREEIMKEARKAAHRLIEQALLEMRARSALRTA